MKTAINIEFTSEELEKYAQNVARRVITVYFKEAGKFLDKSLTPEVGAMIAQALGTIVGAVASKNASKRAMSEEPMPFDASFEAEEKERETPADGGPKTPHMEAPGKKCVRCEPEDTATMFDEGWFCCKCSVYNGIDKQLCRNCNHERCDVIKTPPPATDYGKPDL